MYSLLLCIIFLAGINLGLPNSHLGSALPLMVNEFEIPLSCAGLLSTVCTTGSIMACFASERMVQKYGVGLVLTGAVMVSAGALLGYALASTFMFLCIVSIAYGFGSGVVDTVLNGYLVQWFPSRCLSLYHCSWGVGATIGPYIMGWAIAEKSGWRSGYSAVSAIQLAVAFVVFLSLPLWRRNKNDMGREGRSVSVGEGSMLKTRGVLPAASGFFLYAIFDSAIFLWTCTYLVECKGASPDTAAAYVAFFSLGITAGRFISGFIADAVGDKNMIRAGIGIMLTGTILLAMPISFTACAATLFVMGLGEGPVYPSMVHYTSELFGREKSVRVVNIELAFNRCGNILMAPVFGVIAQCVSMAIFPLYTGFFIVLLLITREYINKKYLN